MSNSGSFALTRSHGTDRFYNPPPARRHQELLLRQPQPQRQLQRALKPEARVESPEVETRTNSDESTLSRPYSDSSSSSSPRKDSNLTNLDRIMESVAPSVPAQFFSETRIKECRTREADTFPFFCLEDLWESFREWSVYGVGVPLLLNGSDSVKQYYVPSLSGIQLYIDPDRLRRPNEDSDPESSRETSSAGSSDCEAERRAKGVVDGECSQHNRMNLNSQKLNRLALGDKQPISSSGDETEGYNSSGCLVFEYYENEQPHHRKPLYDTVLNLASQFPELKIYKSSDLLPISWVCVAWYPIYRIPLGPTLQSLDASFLTFHSLSTHGRSENQPQLHASGGRKVYSTDTFSKMSLPVFGLATYKLGGSILRPNSAHEWQQANTMLQAADNWLQQLQIGFQPSRPHGCSSFFMEEAAGPKYTGRQKNASEPLPQAH